MASPFSQEEKQILLETKDLKARKQELENLLRNDWKRQIFCIEKHSQYFLSPIN